MTEFDRESPPPLVLLANDQEWSARSLESILGPRGFASIRAYTGKQALDLARRTQPDVVIVDASMPDLSGIEVCQRLRQDLEFPFSTAIVLTTAGPASRSQRLEAYTAGAWEFFSMPLDAEALILKLTLFIKAKREIDRWKSESLLDAGTGLYNVRGLARRAREIGADATRRHTPLACVAISTQPDESSDGLGEPDLEPREAEHFSDICRRTARSSDAVGRLGRTEFAIIAPATDEQGAVRLVERLRDMVDTIPLAHTGTPRRFRVRAGYCAVPDFANSSVDAVELLLRAATALRHGRHAEAKGAITGFEDVPVRFVQ